jgi:hypothetical protein
MVQKQCDLAVDIGDVLDPVKQPPLLSSGGPDGLVLTPQPKFAKPSGFTGAIVDGEVAVLSARIGLLLKVADELRIRALDESADTMNAIHERDALVKEKEAWLEEKRRILDEKAVFDREKSTLVQNLQDAMKVHVFGCVSCRSVILVLATRRRPIERRSSGQRQWSAVVVCIRKSPSFGLLLQSLQRP